MSTRLQQVFDGAVSGDRRLLARAISLIEGRVGGINEVLSGLQTRRSVDPGRPHVIGLTGPPGAGKSTFSSQIVSLARSQGHRVAVIAVDPSSPFSGGAILGDRLRMEAHADDAGVFIRSLASRGHLGGLSRATGQVVDLLDAVGFDTILVETVGVGQSELSVMEVADTVVVVLTPESGDTVQTMKAGLLEVGDIFVVNKADRPGADRLTRELEQMVQLDSRFAGAFGVTRGIQAESIWEAPVYASSALSGEGISDVMSAAQTHRDWCTKQGRPAWTARRAAGRVRTFLDLAAEAGRTAAVQIIDADQGRLREALMQGLNPYELAASVGGE
jgi:LAO/AO transport system kinase